MYGFSVELLPVTPKKMFICRQLSTAQYIAHSLALFCVWLKRNSTDIFLKKFCIIWSVRHKHNHSDWFGVKCRAAVSLVIRAFDW